MAPSLEYFTDKGVDPKRSMKGILTPEGAGVLNRRIGRPVFSEGEEVEIKTFPDGSFTYVTKEKTSLIAPIGGDENIFGVVFNSKEK